MFSFKKRISGVKGAPVSPSGETEVRDVELVLVLVDSRSLVQAQLTISAVTNAAYREAGDVLQILGPLILVGFGTLTPGQNTTQSRRAFVQSVIADNRILIRVVHGRLPALCGIVGGELRVSFTAIPEMFPELLQRLVSLEPGGCHEVSA